MFGPNSELTAICMCLRGGVNGSAHQWEPDWIDATLEMLNARLSTWERGGSREERLDNAVKQLVEATILEVRSFDWWQK